MKSNILDYIKKKLCSKSVQPSSLIKEDLGIDSISLVNLLTELCTEFDVDMMTLSDSDLIKVATITDLIALISSKKQNKLS